MRIAFAIAILAVPPAFADVSGPNGRTMDCFCTDGQGLRIELGEITCLTVGGRAFMAQCDMSLNVPTWREIGQGCLSSDAKPGPRERLLQLNAQNPSSKI